MHLAPNIRRIRKDQKGRLVMDSRSSSLRRKDSKPSRSDSNREETQSSIASCVFHIPLLHQLPRRLLQQSVELIEIGVAFDEVSQNFPWKTIESSTVVSVQRPYSTSIFLHSDPSDFEIINLEVVIPWGATRAKISKQCWGLKPLHMKLQRSRNNKAVLYTCGCTNVKGDCFSLIWNGGSGISA